jgi:hypothetical protein
MYILMVMKPTGPFTLNRMLSFLVGHLATFSPGSRLPRFPDFVEGVPNNGMTLTGYQYNLAGDLVPVPRLFYNDRYLAPGRSGSRTDGPMSWPPCSSCLAGWRCDSPSGQVPHGNALAQRGAALCPPVGASVNAAHLVVPACRGRWLRYDKRAGIGSYNRSTRWWTLFSQLYPGRMPDISLSKTTGTFGKEVESRPVFRKPRRAIIRRAIYRNS